MTTEVELEEQERLQTLEDEAWALAAAKAEKSGYIGPEETMKLLTRYADADAAEEPGTHQATGTGSAGFC